MAERNPGRSHGDRAGGDAGEPVLVKAGEASPLALATPLSNRRRSVGEGIIFPKSRPRQDRVPGSTGDDANRGHDDGWGEVMVRAYGNGGSDPPSAARRDAGAAGPAGAGPLLRLCLLVSRVAHPIARRLVAKRLANGKEDPARYREKFGIPSQPRPPGTLVWMHAVGVGEILALPGLVRTIRERAPDLQVLLTSTARTSAVAVAANMPPGTRHQFLPVDCMKFVRPFLDHWQPDLSVWAERDIWPALVFETHRRGVPLAMVNGRMDAASYRAKRKVRGLYSDLYRRFALVGAQDPGSAGRFRALGAPDARVFVSGSLKAGALPLADRPRERKLLNAALGGRRVWLAASTHPADETVVAEAHVRVLRHDPTACLVIAPRDPLRAKEVVMHLESRSISCEVVRDGVAPAATAQAIVVDRIGQLGLWYRLARRTFIGGSMGDTGGHNPYEPARLGCAVIHGPCVTNFAADYSAFHDAGAARLVTDPDELASAVLDPELSLTAGRAEPILRRGEAILGDTAARLLSLLHPNGR